jgi:hypothetical protein
MTDRDARAQRLGVVDATATPGKIAHANVDRHPHAVDGTTQHDAFAVKFDLPHAAICGSVVRVEADGQRRGQAALRGSAVGLILVAV